MDLVTIIVIAVGLSMDALAVAIATGAVCRQTKYNHALRMAVVFGLFQAIMPVIGWLAGLSFKDLIKDYDHWVAFGLLAIIGSKMIYESFAIKPDDKKPSLTTAALILLGVATSIDALAVGVTFSLLMAGSLMIAVTVIGLVTFGFSYGGFYLGKKLGHFFENKIELLGGLILIAIGLKILFQHIYA